MKQMKAFKFKLEPTAEQAEQLEQMVGNARFVWNKFLAMNLYRLDNKYPLVWYNEMSKMLTLWKKTDDLVFLKLSEAQTLQQKLKDLDRAFKDGFDKNQPLKRIPTFKKKGRDTDSIRFPNGKTIKIVGEHNVVSLPKIGEIKFRRSRKVKGEIRNVTVSLKNGKWYISFQCRVDIQPTAKTTSAVGIDMGIVKFATITDGKNHQQFDPLNSMRKSESKLAKVQRKLKAKKKFSSNWKKQQRRIAKIHSHIANQRQDFLHKLSTNISKNHAIVFVEDLKIRNMSKSAKGNMEKHGKNVKAKSGLNKSILDQGWATFVSMLDYKLQWQAGQLWKVNPKNTSRECPSCGHTHKDNRQTQAHFECVECGFIENADIVGAINVLTRGLRGFACQQAA